MPPKPKQTNNTNNEMINFYSHKDIQKHLTQYHNPHYEQTQISIVSLHLRRAEKHNGC